ncbi:MAG: hypothetical protein Q7T89_15995, partial [Anaerolineales bacterium]|nr:hypothetical protein [Anaerolineales bacterium]
TSIAYTNLAGGLFGSGIMLTDPGIPASGACQAHDATSGQNVIIITYDLQLTGSGVMNPNIINTATLLSYSSSEGGTNFIPSGLTDTAEVTPVLPSLAKTLRITSEAHTSDVSTPPRVAIGEIARYRLSVTLPEGSFTNFQIDDNLPGGMVYIDDNTARVAFISNGAGISSTAVGIVPAIPAAGCQVNGNALAALPDPLPCVLADFNVGINNSTAADADTRSSYTQGLDPQFKLGNIVNADSDNDSEFVVIEFNALVDNSVAGSNDLSENRDNNFGVNVNGAAYGANSANLQVRISEPSITNLNKVAAPISGDAADDILYTVTFSNAGLVNNTTAFDVNLTDIVPAKMTPNLAGLTTAYVPAGCSSLTANTSAGNNINLTFGVVPAGCAVTVTYHAVLNVTVIPGEVLTNTANLTYTSLPGTHGTAVNPTGSTVNDGDGATTNDNPGGDKGERTGSALPVHNDYFDTDPATVTVNSSSSAKSFIITSEAHTSDVATPPDVTIGEIIRYRLISPVPEGTSPDFQVVDFLPNGLTFLNDSTARVAFVSDVSIVSAATGTSVPAISGCAVAAIPAFNSLTCVLADGNVSSSLDINSDPDTFGSGSWIYFRLGNLTNNDSDSGVGTPGIEYVVIEFNALVDNTVAGSNNAGDDRDNSSRTYINNAYSGPISNVVPANIVEPAHNLTKTATPNSGDAGDTITYLLTYTNNGSATAFDVSLTDTVPGKMTAALGGMIIVQNP